MSVTSKLRIIDNRKNKNERMYCDLCEYPILTSADFVASEKYMCCDECFLTFVQARKSSWKKGSRPKENVLDSYIETKDKLSQKFRSIE